MKLRQIAVSVAIVTASIAAWAVDAHHEAAAQTPAAALTEGEVRKVDKDAGKVTIKHGEIKNLEMPPMTMVFRVADPKLLDQVKAGDKVKFRAEKSGGAYTVTEMAVAP